MKMDSMCHLQAISKEETTCTLITKEGERTEVKPILMAVIHLSLELLSIAVANF